MRSTDTEKIAAWPRLTRFYGITPLELLRTPNWILRYYIESLPGLEAGEQLLALQAADHPHIEQADRVKAHRSLVEMAGLQTPDVESKVDMTTAEGRRVLHGLGIRVVAEKVTNA